MQFTRRVILRSAAAALAAAGLPHRLWAANTLTMGGVTLDTLSDGHLVLPRDFILGGLPEAELAPILDRYGITGDALMPPCNVTLLRDGTNTVLFDVGSGPDFQPTAGKLGDALAALGLTPEDVTHVVFTHAHPDHLWGLLDEFDEPVFANATHMIGKAEWDYWMDPATVDSIGTSRTAFAVGARRRLEAMQDRIATFGDGEEILPGIASRLSPGHTPGHMAFELRSGSESVMVVGDAIGNHHVGFERPLWKSGSDQDPDMAAPTRAALLDQIATGQMRLIGFHLPEGGLGRAEKTADGYRFVPEV
ncbi:MBL fold metallo-hydrolase [Rhodobacter veldkampii DSM 11550]|uniref:MBL fold metallo-hydrolase n=1 Tax=Phaeovulum veldkampii DSM 11550 TaxID=1185920 RepID=A0A2T4JJR1_9RHOB|nr:MBL fold metallo-hydrolase [Phaeovulum veldkampii]MBK5945061.1 MBL fold metallo-hydrolase [Phaeovulum veldkampii DSM 11550]PTE18103.1 MBL fold metallo-hydrolase [Phaeovulum veldkampii DSM 11550]TDQ57089.1 glyoxylase-like metal-dependent hydrolase (beta-lactamase superfamily II) [Phaeovulum veldkampii DSM 11550]